MSVMDKIKHMLKGHESQADQGIEKTGDFVDDKTKGKHRRQVDTAQDTMREQFGTDRDRDNPPQP
ncbi:antitoxin [Streptomyces sp. NPDC048479]|uniref:antitoxin n=1 Tax=unclassified Streptomyces TaxID=2593676 RepID=UPI002E15D346|nr:antitoxin [Streptomyces sp. NBC_01210]